MGCFKLWKFLLFVPWIIRHPKYEWSIKLQACIFFYLKAMSSLVLWMHECLEISSGLVHWVHLVFIIMVKFVLETYDPFSSLCWDYLFACSCISIVAQLSIDDINWASILLHITSFMFTCVLFTTYLSWENKYLHMKTFS